MTLDEFQNGLRLLRSIDLHELQAVGLWTEADETTQTRMAGYVWDKWRQFRDNPYEFLVRCDGDTAAKIFTIIEKRSRTEPTTAAGISSAHAADGAGFPWGRW